jgi:hypothetical protein
MVLLRRFTPLVAVSLLLFLAACQDQSSPADPLGVDVVPSMSHVTTDHVDLTDPGLFFFRPPIDTDELTVGSLDTGVQQALSVELCNVEGLVGFDPFASVCPAGRLVGRLDDTDLSIESAGSFDFYQGSFGLNGLEVTVGDLHTITVMFDLPDGTFFAYGHVSAIFTDNASEADPDGDPPVYRVGELPIKFYVSDLATRQLICGDVVPCTYEFWGTENTEDICYPENECDGNNATAGLRADPEALQEIAELTGQSEILVVCTGVDPEQLEGMVLPIVLESWVDCDLGFDGELESTFAVQLCLPNGVQDREAFVGAHFAEGVLDFLLEGSGPEVFSEDNCQNPGELAENAGLLDRMRYAALNGVLRPVARFLGPQPLLAWNATTWDSNKASPLGPAELLGVFQNHGPEPIELAGSTVPVSVCVAATHLDPPVASGNPVDVHFEVNSGGGSIAGSDPDGTKTVTAVLRATTADDDCAYTDGSGQIAEASVQWTLGPAAALNELTASIPGEFTQTVIGEGGAATGEELDLSVTFSTQTVEVLGQCTAASGFDEFGHRGIYILPSEFGMVGDDLNMVQLRISSNNSTNGKGLAGEYRVSLSARDGTYDPGATIQTVETTFTLSGDAPENETVTFSFDQLQDLGPAPVAFVAEILDAPKQNARLWFLVPDDDQVDGYPQRGSLACPGAIVTNGTTFTTPLDTDRRQGVDIRLFGVNNGS